MTIEKELIKSLARKYGITQAQVEELVYSQHRFLAHVMSKKSDRESLYFPSVRILGLGIFYCSEKTKKRLLYLKENRNKNEHI